ncbi:MAG: hypothetical protein IT236_04410 [Bacteroidia bacterium]|nr:hypothetical protein [Bacteroidia bacterium]
MKKVFYTAALITVFGFCANAQSTSTVAPKQENPKQEKVNADGTKKEEKEVKKGEGDAKDGTRMAITQKGLPAPKNKVAKDGAKENKENKEVKGSETK